MSSIECRALTGAWIETAPNGQQRSVPLAVAPSRARGLKLAVFDVKRVRFLCRALTGAWIETNHTTTKSIATGVAPSRARGLKQYGSRPMVYQISVAPSRARGLKRLIDVEIDGYLSVAPSRARGLKQLR